MKSILNTRLAKGASVLAISALFGASQANAQTLETYGDWVQSGTHVEYYVARTGASPLPAGVTVLPNITSALAQAVTDGTFGTVPVTINVAAAAGTYGAFVGEVFPIQLPVHGVSIEAYDVSTVNGKPIVASGGFGGGAQEIFLFNSIGNSDLPPSVLRGLEVRNNSGAANAAEVRVDITTGTVSPGDRIPLEIRDCLIRGAADLGVDLVGDEVASMEVVLERNVIEAAASGPNQANVGLRVTGGLAPCSPLIRANDIRLFPLNVQIAGGGESNQTRLQSNFIQVGDTNVQLRECAPWIISNTIAFAFKPKGVAVGIDMGGITDYTLSHNLIWNPKQLGMSTDPVDVQNLSATFTPVTSSFRNNWINMDEDDAIIAAGFTLNHPTGGIGGVGVQPDFVGGDTGSGLGVTDLHLNTTSLLIDLGIYPEFQNDLTTWDRENDVSGAGSTIYIRTDHGHDRDFDPRVVGYMTEIGADEVVADLGPTSFTRAAHIRVHPGLPGFADVDAIGNMKPSAAGNWEANILFQGNVPPSGSVPDIVTLVMGYGFMDLEPSTLNPAGTIENRSLYQNILFNGLIIPGVSGHASYTLDLGAGSLMLATTLVDALGEATWTVNLGPATAGFVEGEIFLQALVLSSTGNAVASNRMPIELNL